MKNLLIKLDDIDNYSKDITDPKRCRTVWGRFLLAHNELFKETKHCSDDFYKSVGSVDRLFESQRLYTSTESAMKTLSFKKLETYFREEFGNIKFLTPTINSKDNSVKSINYTIGIKVFDSLNIESVEEYVDGKMEEYIVCNGVAGKVNTYIECKRLSNKTMRVSAVVIDESGIYKPVYLQNNSNNYKKTDKSEYEGGYIGSLDPVVSFPIDYVGIRDYLDLKKSLLITKTRNFDCDVLKELEGFIDEILSSNPQRRVVDNYYSPLMLLSFDIENFYKDAKNAGMENLSPCLKLDSNKLSVKFSWFNN